MHKYELVPNFSKCYDNRALYIPFYRVHIRHHKRTQSTQAFLKYMSQHQRYKNFAEVFSYIMLGISFIDKDILGRLYYTIIAFIVCMITFCVVMMFVEKD